MLDGRRKSMQPMAARLGVDHQRLQQFITNSPWDVAPVRRTLARLAIGVIQPEAWVIDDTGQAKEGTASACVARQYSGTLGKIGNCQVAVSVHAVTDAASVAINWALFVPESWDDTTTTDADKVAQIRQRRARCKIPDGIRHREKWRLALDMLDQITSPPTSDRAEDGAEAGAGAGRGGEERGEGVGWGLPRRTTVADAGYGDVTGFRLGLEQRGLPYVVAVKGTTSAHSADTVPTAPAYSGRGRPPKPRYRDDPSSLTALALATGRNAVTHLTWRHGSRRNPANPAAALRSHFLAIRVRPANREIPRNADGSLPECWLIAEWPPDKAEPTDYWLSNLPADTPLEQLVRLAKIRWRIEHDYRELKDGLGLDHFEGRSYTGWHRHVTLAALAQAFCTHLRNDPKAPAPA